MQTEQDSAGRHLRSWEKHKVPKVKLAEMVQIRIYSAIATTPSLGSCARGAFGLGWIMANEISAREIRTVGRRLVSVQSSKFLLAIMLTGVLGPMPARMFGQAAAAPAAAQPQKNWKDRAEYDLYDSITKDTNSQDQAREAAAVGEAVSDDGVDQCTPDAVPDHLRRR